MCLKQNEKSLAKYRDHVHRIEIEFRLNFIDHNAHKTKFRKLLCIQIKF